MKKQRIIRWSMLLGGIALFASAIVGHFIYAEETKKEDDAEKATLQTKEDYQISEGEVYVYGASDKKYSNTEEKNAITQAIEDVLKSDKTEAIIVVAEGTYDGGIEIDCKKDKPFKLSIVSDDSFTKVKDSDADTCIPSTTTEVDGESVTSYTFNSSSSGKAVVLGGIKTKNISLTLAGIYLGNTLKESIDDLGSQDIDVTGGSGFTYYGTELADKVNIELTHVGNKISIDLGSGNDTLDFKLTKAPTETLSYKSIYEDITSDDWANDIETTIKSTIEGIKEPDTQEISILGGAGSDTISSMIMNASDITIDDSNGLSLLMDVTPVNLKIDSGSGSDRVSVGGGIAMNSLKVIALQAAYNALYSLSSGYESTISVLLGDGDDYCDVISTISYISYGTASITVTGGNGYDHINLDGKLGTKKTEDLIRGTASDLKLATMAEISIFDDAASVAKIYGHVNLSLVSETITDTLSNKATVSVYQKDNTLFDKETNLEVVFNSFTDYVIEDYDSKKAITNLNGEDCFLTNVVIEADTQLLLGNISLPNLTVLANVEDSGINSDILIEASGTILAKNLLIRVENSDSHSLSVISSDLDSDSDAEIEASCFDVASSITVEILDTANITASNVFDILISSTQTQGLLPTASGLSLGTIPDDGTNPNFVVVKTSDVCVNVYGTIMASGIRIVASTSVETESQNQALKDFGIPVAVGVVSTNASITVESANITSANGITLLASSDDSLSVTAMTGLLPFTLSTAVVVNKTHVDVLGDSVLAAGGDIVLYSRSDVITRTISTGTCDGSKLISSSKVDTSASGGFFTVSVVLSDVHSEITDNTEISSGGALYIYSDSSMDIVNQATSNPESEGDSKSLVDIIDDLKDTFTKAKKNPIFTKKNAQEALTSVINKLTGEQNGVKNLFDSSTSGATEEDKDEDKDDSNSDDKDKDKKESGESQLVGALAVTYTDNDNKALFETTGKVTITEKATVKSNGSVSILTLADGSPVKRTSKASGASNKEEVEKPEEKKTNEIKNGIVTVEACDNGTVTLTNESEEDKDILVGNAVTIKVTAEAGYKIKSFVIKEEGKADDTPSNVVGKDSAELSGITFDGKTTISITFEEKEIELICENTDTSLYTLTSYSDSSLETITAHADKGDKVYVSAKCKGGVSLKNINYKYQKNGATIKGTLEKNGGIYSLTLPKGSYYTITFTAEVELTELELQTKETNSVSGNKVDFYDSNRKSITKANVGDKVTLEIVCTEGSYVKKDGIKLQDEVLPVKVEENTYTVELTIKYIKSTPDSFKVTIEFTSKESEKEGYTAKKTALGVGINVNVTTYSNVARMNLNGTLNTLGGADVEANTTKHDIEAIAKAGFTAADFGLAGTVTVNVVSSKTLADFMVFGKVTMEDESDIAVKSNVAASKVVTIADAGGVDADGTSKSDDGIGVGAGIGVQVLGVDVITTVESTGITPKTTKLGGLEVSSSFSGNENLLSKAGASGGKAVVPVLSLDVSGVYVKTDVSMDEKAYADDVTIESSNENERTLTADAKAIGANVAVGGSFVISVINDSALTTVDANITTDKTIKVTSSSTSKATLDAKAGANGAKEDESSDKEGTEKNLSDDNAKVDKSVDSNLTGAGKIAGTVDSKNTNESNVTDAKENRQKAETSEGNVSVAASVTVNVMNNKAITETLDDVILKAKGETEESDSDDDSEDEDKGIVVSSTVDTDAIISANSSTANSTKGVAVGVAVNVVNYENKVILGKGTYESEEDFTVKAIINDKELEDKTAELVTDLVNKLLTVFSAEELANVLVCDEKDTFKEYVIAIALELDFTSEELSSKLSDSDVSILDNLIAALVERIKCSIKDEDYEETVLEEYQTLVEEVMLRLIKKFKNGTAINNILSKSSEIEKIFTDVKKNTTDKDKWKEVLNSALTALAYILGSDDELDGVGSKISTSAISGAGASSVGVAGSLAISVVNEDTYTILSPGSEVNVDGNFILNADGAQTVFTTATAAVNPEGKADKNKTTTNASASTNNGATNDSTASSKDSSKSVGVGASIAIAFVDCNVYSGVGYHEDLSSVYYDTTIESGTLDIRAISRNDADTISVSGSDPLAAAEDGKEEKVRNEIAVDASVAVAILNNNVHAYIGQKTTVTLGDTNGITNPIDEDEKINGLLYAKESGSTLANASGYAIGGNTAVGAAVAVNLSLGDVDVLVDGTVKSSGTVVCATESLNHDDANALALAMGADMDRYTDKMNQMKVLTQKKEESNSSKSTDSSSNNEINTSTKTGDKISENLDKNSNDKTTKSDSSKSLSESVLQSENVKTESVSQTEDDDLGDAIGNLFGDDADKTQTKEEKKNNLEQIVDAGNNNENEEANPSDSVSSAMNGDNVSDDAKKSKNITIAAAVGLNITSHKLHIEINETMEASNLIISSKDNGNFQTISTGAAVSLAENTNSIGASVAVSVNHNESIIDINNNLASTGNIKINSNLTTNLDGTYGGKYGALAIAGAASGKGGSATVAGAITVMVANTTTEINLADSIRIIATDDIEIISNDKTKLNTGAIAATLSKGTTVGVGAAFALLYAKNEVITKIGVNVYIEGGSVTIDAIKEKVTIKDYNSPFKAAEILTIKMDTTEVTDSDGIFVITEKDGKYDATVNVQTDDISTAVELTSALGTGNYSALAIAGTIVGNESSSKAAVAGSAAMLFDTSYVTVTLADNVYIKSIDEDVLITSEADNNGILIGGAASVSSATAGVGANAGIVISKDKVEVLFGNNVQIISGKDISIESTSDNEIVAVSIAAAVSGTDAKATIGGGITVIVSKNTIEIEIGEDCYIYAEKDIKINTSNDSNMDVISLSVAVQKSESGAVAVGGTVDVIIGKNNTLLNIGNTGYIKAITGEIYIKSNNSENLVSVLGSVSAASSATSAAATVDVLVTSSKSIVHVGGETIIESELDTTIESTGNSNLIGVELAAAVGGSKGPSVGATILVNVFNRELYVGIHDSASISSNNGSVIISSYDDEKTILVSIDAAVSTGSVAVAGNIQANVGRSKIITEIESNVSIMAKNNIAILANQNSVNVLVAPSASVSLGSVGVGATVVVTVLRNRIEALTQDKVELIAYNSDASSTVSVPEKDTIKQKRGIILNANINNKTAMCGVGVAVSSGAAVSGVIDTLVVRNTCYARMGARNKATVSGSSDDMEGDSCGLIIEANDNSFLLNFGGAVSAAATTGVGATVVTLVFNSDVEAYILDDCEIDSNGVVYVAANDVYDLYLVGVSFSAGLSGASVGAGGSVLVYGNETYAGIGGRINAKGNIVVLANNKSMLLNASASVAVNNVAVAGSALVTYLEGETLAEVFGNSDLYSDSDIIIRAISNESIVSEAIGVSGATGAAVSGVVDVMVNSIKTNAVTGDYVAITANDLVIEAKDTYALDSIAASAALAGSAGVGVTAVVTVAKNEVIGSIGEYNTIIAQNVEIIANSDRYVLSVAGTVGGGLTAGVGATVMVTVVGSKLDSDSSEAILDSFDREAFMKDMSENSPAAKDYYKNRDLSELDSSGIKASDTTVGSPNENGDYEYSSTDGYDTSNETFTKGENKDQENANQISLGMKSIEKTDSIIAFVGNHSTIEAANKVEVNALDNLVIDAITASVAGGSLAGVGVGISVCISNSNVFAYVNEDVRIACDTFVLEATGMSMGDEVNSDIKDAYKSASNEEIDTPSIHVISASAAASGQVGVGVAVALVSLTSNIEAIFNGYQLICLDSTIEANSIYNGIVATTLGFGLGTVGVSASVAIVDYDGYTLATIASNSFVEVDNLSIITNSENNTKTIAAAMAGGAVAVNGGVSVSINKNTSETYISQGAVIRANGNVIVLNNSIAVANSYLIGASVGAVAVSLSAGVAILKPVILTYAGAGPTSSSQGESLEKKGSIQASYLTIDNQIQSSSETTILSLAGGGIAVNGNALLVFNDTIAYACINSMNIEADKIRINGSLDATGNSYLASAVVGAISVGISVSYVGLDYTNYVILNYDDVTVQTNDLSITAGDELNHNVASANSNTLVANSGAVAANLNAAITDNHAINSAYCSGTGEIQATGDVYVNAYLDATSNTTIRGLSGLSDVEVAGVSVNAGTSIAINRAINHAVLIGDFNCDEINVIASINEDMDSANAKLYQGQSKTVVAVTASVAVSYAQMENLASFITNKTVVDENIVVESIGQAISNAISGNLTSVSVASAAVLVSYSYSTASFTSEFDGKYVSAKNLSILTDYYANASSTVTPSNGGAIDISLGSVKTNLAIAKTETKGEVNVSSTKALTIGNLLAIGVNLNSDANALVNSVVFASSVVKVTTNASLAEINDILVNTIDISGSITANAINVYNLYNDSSSGAKSIVGGNDISSITGSISFVDVTTNVAKAYDNVLNKLSINGKPNISAKEDIRITASTNGKAVAKTISSTIAASVASIGNMFTDASVLDNTDMSLALGKTISKYGNIAICVNSTPEVISSADAPMVQVSGISETSVNAEGSIGTKDQMARVGLVLSSGDIYANNGDITIEALNHPGKNLIEVNAGTNVSILTISVNSLETKTYLESELDIFDNVSLHATKISDNQNSGSDIIIQSEALPNASLTASSTNIGVALSVSDLTIKNTAVTRSSLSIGNDFTAYSSGRIHMIGDSSANLNSYASGITGGTIAGSGIETSNKVERTVVVEIGDAANVYAYSANEDALVISANTGRKDNLSAVIDDTVAGLVGISAAKAFTTVNDNQKVSIGKDSYYMALNGTVTIESDYGISSLNNKIDSLSAGLASLMIGKANTELTIKSTLDINYEDVDSDNTVYIVGQYANVLNYAKNWNVNNELLMENAAVTGNVAFENKLDVNLDLNNYISGCYIDGIEEAYLTASFITPLLNDSTNFQSNNNASVSLAKISTDAIKNACTDFWKNSNSSVSGKVVMNIGTVELYSTSDNRYFTGCGYNQIDGITYSSNVDINNGDYVALNVLSSNLSVAINQRKNQDGYAFLYFKNISRNIRVLDITNLDVTIHDNSDSVSISKNTTDGDTIYLGELSSYMTSYSGYYKCDLSDLYIINRSSYNVCFDIITNTNNSNFPRGTITAYSLSDKNISILNQHEDYQSYHLYADWVGEEGGYLNLGSSADVYVEINSDSTNVSGVSSDYITSTETTVTIDLSSLEGSYISYSMNTTVTNCKEVIQSAQGIRSLIVYNRTNKNLILNDVSVDSYIHITSTQESNVSLAKVEALADVSIAFEKGGNLTVSDSINTEVLSITGVDSLGTKENPLNIETKEKCDMNLIATNDIYIHFTNTDRKITSNELSLNIESLSGSVYFNYELNNGEYGLTTMDIKNILATNVDIYFTCKALTQNSIIKIYSSSLRNSADITADTLQIHHENGICRMDLGSEDTPFEINASGNVVLNGLQKCYLTQLGEDLHLDFEKSQMTFFKDEDEYQEWLAGRTPDLEYIFEVHTNGSLYINSLAAGSTKDYYALAYWDRVVLDVKNDLTINDGDCMVIDLDITCSGNLTINGTLNMHKYLNDIILDLSGNVYIENIEKVNVLDITAMGSIVIDGDVYVNERLSLKSSTKNVTISGNIMQESVGSYYGAKDVTITSYSDVSIGAINPNSRYTIVSLYGDVSIYDSYNPSWISITSTKLLDVEALNGSVSIYGNDTTYVNASLGASIKIKAKKDIYYYAKLNDLGEMEYGDILFNMFVGDAFDIESKTGDVYLGNIGIKNTIYYGNVSPGAIMNFKNNVYISSITVDTSLAKVTSTKNITIYSLSGKNGHYTINALGNVFIDSFSTQTGTLKINALDVNLDTVNGGQVLNVTATNFFVNDISDVGTIEIKANTIDLPTVEIHASNSISIDAEYVDIKSLTSNSVQIKSSNVAGTIDKPIIVNSSNVTFYGLNCYLDCTDKLVIRMNDITMYSDINTLKDLDIKLYNVVFGGNITCNNLTGIIKNSCMYSVDAKDITIQFEDSSLKGCIQATGDVSFTGKVDVVSDVYAQNVSFKLRESKIIGNIQATASIDLALSNLSSVTSGYIYSPTTTISMGGSFGAKQNFIDLGTTNLSYIQEYGSSYIQGNDICLLAFDSQSDSKVSIIADKITGTFKLSPREEVSLCANTIELEFTNNPNYVVYDTKIIMNSPIATVTMSGDQSIDMYLLDSISLDITADISTLHIIHEFNMEITGTITADIVSIDSKDNDVSLSNLKILSTKENASLDITAYSIDMNTVTIDLGNNSKVNINSITDIEITGSISANEVILNGDTISGKAVISSIKSASLEASTIEIEGSISGKEVTLFADRVIANSIYANTYNLLAVDKVSGYDDSVSTIYGYSSNSVDFNLNILSSTIFNVKEASNVTLNVHGILDKNEVDIIKTTYDAEELYLGITYLGNTLKLIDDVVLTRPLVLSSNGVISGIDFNGHSITGTVIIDESLSNAFILKNGTLVLDDASKQPLMIINGYIHLSNMTIKNTDGTAIFSINGKISIVGNTTIEGDPTLSMYLCSTIAAKGMSVSLTVSGNEEAYNYTSAITSYLISSGATKLVFVGSTKDDGMEDITRFIKAGMEITYDVSNILPEGATIGFGDDYTNTSISISYLEARTKMGDYQNSTEYDIPYKITYSDSLTSIGVVTITLYDITGGLDITATYVYNDGSIPNELDRLPITYGRTDGYMVPILHFTTKSEDTSVSSYGTFTNEMFTYYFDGCTFKFFYDENTNEDPDRLILEHTTYELDEIFKPTQYVHGEVVVYLNPNEELSNLTSNITFENTSDARKFAFYIYVDHVPEVHIINDYFTYKPTFTLNEETGEVTHSNIHIWDYLESYEVDNLEDYCYVRVFVFGLQEMDEDFNVSTNGDYIALVDVYYGLDYTSLYLHFKVDNKTQYKITLISNGHETIEYHNPGEIIYGYGYNYVGYTFAGWYCDDILNNHNITPEVYSEGKDKVLSELMVCVTSDMVFEARYTEGYPEGTDLVEATIIINGVKTTVTMIDMYSQIYYAPEIEGYTFVKWMDWYINDDGVLESEDRTTEVYEFISPEGIYEIVYIPNDIIINVDGVDSTKKYDEKVTLIATPNDNQEFIGWYINNKLVSSDLEYTFTVKEYVEITSSYTDIVTIIIQSWNDSTTKKVSLGKTYSFTREDLAERTFIGWYFDDVLVGTTDTIQISFEASGTLVARYETKEYDVTIKANDGISYLGNAKANSFTDYILRVQTTGCKTLTKEYITVSIKDTLNENYTFVDGILTIPMEDIIGNVLITISMDSIHNYIHHEKVWETCTLDGNIEYYTCGCGKYYLDSEGKNEITEEDIVISKHHTLSHVDLVAETCTTNGILAHDTCSVCGKIFLNDALVTENALVIKAHHSFGEFIHGVESTCTTNGTEAHYECIACHKYFNQDGYEIIELELPLLSHSLEHVDKVAETCTSNGTRAYDYCSVCGKKFIDDLEVKEAELVIEAHHTLSHVEAKEETCTSVGWDSYDYCSVCDYSTYHEKEALGHTYEWVIDVSATVASTGLKHEECTRCHDVRNENTVIPVVECEHNLSKTEKVLPTCEASGMKEYYTCSICHKVYSESTGQLEVIDSSSLVIDALGHTFVVDEAVMATCVATGLTEGSHCSRCGKVAVKQETIEAIAHNITHHDEVASSCTANGVNAYDECLSCHKYFINGVEVTEEKLVIVAHHTLTHVNGKAASYTEEGILEHDFCSSCNKYFDSNGNEITEITIAILKYPVENNEVKNEVTENDLEAGIDISNQLNQAIKEFLSAVIVSGKYSITFDPIAVEAIQKSNSTLSMKTNENDSNYADAILVLEVSLSNISSFGDGYATIEAILDKELEANEHLSVYYVSSDGTRTLVESNYDNHKLSFKTNHFSTYIVVVENTQSSMPIGAILGIVFGSVALLAGAVFVTLKFTVLKRKN